MSTAITDFRTPVRAILGDFDLTVRKYQDTAIDSVVQMVVRSGQLPGFVINAGGTGITPDVIAGRDYGLLIYKAAKAFVTPNAAAYSYRTRALSESFGSQGHFIQQLENALHDIDSGGGAMFSTQLGFRSWFLGMAGVDPWADMADMEVNAPTATVSIGRDGVGVSS
jgi:hypothetical protein